MTKYSLSAASLVTAIPAAYLAYLLVMTFLQKPGFENLAGPFQIIAGLTLTLVTLMVLMPVGILIFGKKPEKAAEPETPADEGEEDGEDLAMEEEDERAERAKTIWRSPTKPTKCSRTREPSSRMMSWGMSLTISKTTASMTTRMTSSNNRLSHHTGETR